MKKLCGVAVVLAISGGVAQAAPGQGEAARPAAIQPSSASRAAEALSRGDNLEALTRADEAVRADPKSGWAHYNRGAALAGLNRIDEAVAAYDQASSSFAASDTRGRSLALWGKAHALYRVGRCDEAKQAFAEYTKIAGSSDASGVAMAADRAQSCKPAKEGATKEATAAKESADEVKPRPSVEAKTGLPSLAKP